MRKKLFFILSIAAILLAAVSCDKNKDKDTDPYLNVEYTPADIPETGGNAAFSIKSNTDWTINVQGGATWLTPNSTSGNGDATITVTVAPNDGEAREGTLEITAGTIKKTVVIKQLETVVNGDVNTLFSFTVNGGAFLEYEDLATYCEATFTLIDKDGDGNNWRVVYLVDNEENPTGEYSIMSESYRNYVGPFTPENYLVLPAVTVTSNGKFTAVLNAIDPEYCFEKFKIVVSSEPITSANCRNATALLTHTLTNGNPYTAKFDIPSEYNGSAAYFAICHFDCTDQFILDLASIEITHQGPAPSPAPALAPATASADRNGTYAMHKSLRRN